MLKHWTANELAEELAKLTIICDTREQRNQHVTDFLDEKGVPRISRKLDCGDYSAAIDGRTLEKSVVIERKHGLDELCVNLAGDRDRFEREFLRAKANGIKVFLLIEDASWDQIYLGDYRSKLPPKSIIASLMAWQVRFNVTVIFCAAANTPRIIYQVLYYAAREDLLNS